LSGLKFEKNIIKRGLK